MRLVVIVLPGQPRRRYALAFTTRAVASCWCGASNRLPILARAYIGWVRRRGLTLNEQAAPLSLPDRRAEQS